MWSFKSVILLLAVLYISCTSAVDVEILETDMDDVHRTFVQATIFAYYDLKLPTDEIARHVKNSLDEAYGRFWSVFIGDEKLVGDFHAKNNTMMKAQVGEDRVTLYRHEFLNEADFVAEGDRNQPIMKYQTNMDKAVIEKFVYQFGVLLKTRHDFESLANAAVTLMSDRVPGIWVCDVASRGYTSFIRSDIAYLQISYDVLRITLLNVGGGAGTEPPTETPEPTTSDPGTTVVQIECEDLFTDCSEVFSDSRSGANKRYAVPIFEDVTKENSIGLCVDRGTKSLEIRSEEENKFVADYVQSVYAKTSHYGYWIGMTRDSNENVWRWDSDGSPLTYTNWDNGQPGSDRNDAYISAADSGHWLSEPYYERFPVCEMVV